MNIITISDDKFLEFYKPLEDKHGDIIDFDPRVTGDDNTFDEAIKNRTLWTEVDGDDGYTYILNGFHHVNRLRHFITEEPYNKGEEIEVVWCEPTDEDFEIN